MCLTVESPVLVSSINPKAACRLGDPQVPNKRPTPGLEPLTTLTSYQSYNLQRPHFSKEAPENPLKTSCSSPFLLVFASYQFLMPGVISAWKRPVKLGPWAEVCRTKFSGTGVPVPAPISLTLGRNSPRCSYEMGCSMASHTHCLTPPLLGIIPSIHFSALPRSWLPEPNSLFPSRDHQLYLPIGGTAAIETPALLKHE